RDFVLLGFGNFTGNLTGISFRTTLHLRWASLVGVFQSLVHGNDFACGFPKMSKGSSLTTPQQKGIERRFRRAKDLFRQNEV
ncbi:MAG: hypothetical protein ABJO67_10745, partial [Pseudoruegeria sp.]